MPHPSRRSRLAAALLAVSLCPASHALERITLRTGFSYDCSHHEAIDANHVRLYLTSSDPTRTDN